jgi:hypothetical protein
MKRLIASFSLGLISASFGSFAAAQSLTTGAITGTVVDQSGAVMASVVVTAKNVDTGATRETQTAGSGNFLLAQLDPGRYEVTAESAGFEKTKIGPITVAVSRVASLEFHLKVGSATATVEVKQEAALIEPSNPNTTTTLNATQLAEIPNPGNDLSYVANLAPGAIMNIGSVHFGGAGNVEFNGLPSVANNFSIDGLDGNNPFYNTNASGVSGLQLGLNAIQEVSINTESYGVDQGRQEAAQINYITKSGTNSFHGNAFEIWNGSAMNANNFFNNLKGIKKPRSNVNEFGASVGGPIVKNKLFFFTDLEGIRIVLPTTLTSTVPTSAYQNYVLQQLPLGGTDSVLGDQLPPQPGEVPLYQNMFKLIGNPSGGIALPVLGCPLNLDGSPASGSPPNGAGCATTKTVSVAPPVSETLFTTKLDYTRNSKDAFWFRFQFNNASEVLPNAVSSIFDSVSSSPVRSGAAGWTHVFSPNLVNQFNPGISYNKLISNIGNPSQGQALFPISYSVDPFSTIGVSGFPFGIANTVWQLNDNLAWNHGRHALKFGENMRRVLISAFTNTNGVIPLEFGCSLPEFTYGAACSTTQSFPKSAGDRIALVNLDLYAMDTLRATNKLTLTIGVRTAWNSNPVSRHNDFSRLAGAFETISHDVNQPLNQVIVSNQANAFESTQLLQWEPRAALAYEVLPKTVFRSGFGIFGTTREAGQAPVALSRNLPLDPTFNGGLQGAVGGVGIAPGVPNSAVDAAVAANQKFQASFASGALSCASASASQANCVPSVSFRAFQSGQWPQTYSMQWSFGIEHQVGKDYGLTVKYLGTRAVKMEYLLGTANSFQRWCQGCFAPLPFNSAPDRRFSSVTEYNTGASSSYHALQITGQKRMGHGLSFQMNYTYSHCLDAVSNGGWSGFNFGSAGVAILPGSLKHYYGNCDYDVRHSMNASYYYELPLHPRRAWLAYAIGGWSLSGTVFLRGGLPLTVFSNGRRNILNGAPLIHANVIPGVNPYTTANIPGVTQPGTIQWLNPNAFQSVFDATTRTCFPTTNVQNCQDGNSGRNAFRAPGFKWTDLNVGKRFKVSEATSFKFDAQFYNLFNHPNFYFPSFPLVGIPGKTATQTRSETISETAMPSTGLLGGRLGDSSVRMIALRARIEF